MVNIYGINLFNLFNLYTKDVIIYVLNGINADMDQRIIRKLNPHSIY